MKKWFIELSNTYKTALISTFVTIIAYLSLVFAYFINQNDLPNGLIVGGLLGSLSYLVLGLVEKEDKNRQKPIWTIIVTIIRYLLIGGLIALSTYLQFKTDYKIFNVFTVLGGYFISLIVYIVIVLIERKHV